MPSQRPVGEIDLDELIDWIKRRPELRHLRQEAAQAKAEYRPGESTPRRRIDLTDDRMLRSAESGPMGKLREIVWVPVRNMRGKSYATPSSDATVNATAKLMSISTLWDFFCTLPLFKFGLAGPMGVMAWPGAVVLSFRILWASNVAGEKATDRHDANHARTANLSLAAFLLLSLAKTAFSGVGIDLFIGSRAIASSYAEQLIEAKITGDRRELARLEADGPELKATAAECTRLQQQLAQINRNKDEKSYQSIFVLAYGSKAAEAANVGKSPSELIRTYGSVGSVPGACTQQKLLRDLQSEKATDLRVATPGIPAEGGTGDLRRELPRERRPAGMGERHHGRGPGHRSVLGAVAEGGVRAAGLLAVLPGGVDHPHRGGNAADLSAVAECGDQGIV
jgi:hypothetical protein